MTGNAPVLDQLAHEINVRLKKADENEGKARDHRIAAGLRLKEARAQIPRGQWGAWLSKNIERSRQDIYKCLALVKSNDPAHQRRARSQERAKVREQVQRSRASAKTVAYVCDKSASADPPRVNNPIDAIRDLAASVVDPLDIIRALVLDLADADFERWKAWFLAHVGVVVTTSPQTEVADEPPPASSGPVDAAPPRPGDGDPLATAPIEATEQHLQAQLDEPEVGAETVDGASSGEAPRVLPADIVADDTLLQVDVQQPRQAASRGPRVEASEQPDDGDLMTIYEGLKPRTQETALWWIEHGCPALSDRPVHFRIIEALASFRAPASKQRFAGWYTGVIGVRGSCQRCPYG